MWREAGLMLRRFEVGRRSTLSLRWFIVVMRPALARSSQSSAPQSTATSSILAIYVADGQVLDLFVIE